MPSIRTLAPLVAALLPHGLAFCGNRPPDSALLRSIQSFSSEAGGCIRAADDFDPPRVRIDVVMNVVTASEATRNSIPRSTLEEQMRVLNEGFRPSNIQYRLRDVVRTVNPTWASLDLRAADSSDIELEMKEALRQGDYRTLNIYYIDNLVDETGGVLTGFCPTPTTAPPGSRNFTLDGCVLHSQTLPGGTFKPWDEGKITVHEVGHWHGLIHVFEGGCSEVDGGDMVCDTPAEQLVEERIGEPYGCPVGRDSCRHTTGPSDSGKDSIHNYMNYYDDSCYSEFTPGQAQLMHDMWSMFRRNSLS